MNTREELMAEVTRIREHDAAMQSIADTLSRMTEEARDRGETMYLVDAARALGLRVTEYISPQPVGTGLVLGGPEPFAIIHYFND